MAKAPDKSHRKNNWFIVFAQATSAWAGSQSAFIIAFGMIVVWGLTGPIFRYSDTWQMVINTGTTIITFLMVFLIQNSQNRDGRIIQLKLDELIRAVEGAEDSLINMEELTEAELEAMHQRFTRLAERAKSVADDTRSGRRARSLDTVAAASKPAAKPSRARARARPAAQAAE
ncbi:MAG: low affinity iron permease family protein [Asticcacaulis sp.]